MEQLVDRFFERMQAQEVQSLSENEIDRIASEVFPYGQPLSPLHEQFLGGWLKKAVKLGKAAFRLATRPLVEVGKLAGKVLMAIGKLALGPLWEGLKRLGRGLLRHVVRFALNKLPASVQPLAKKLSDRLFRAIGETTSGEASEMEQTEREGIPAAPSVARLEAEFDVAAAQLLLGETEQENEQVIGSYTEAEAQEQEQPPGSNWSTGWDTCSLVRIPVR